MKLKIKALCYIIVLFFISNAQAQVTELWTDFGGFWNSSSTNLNPTQPRNTHHLLAFRFNGTVYSTNVNNTILDANDVTGYTTLNFRALPIATLPTTSPQVAYFVGLGASFDGLPTAVDNSSTSPFPAITNGNQVASFLTRGINGLDLGSCLTNIPSGTSARFNLSSAGVTVANIGDGIPDILVSQIAQPTSTGVDQLRFVNSSGATVGNVVSINLSNDTNFPALGKWNVDFYNFNSTQTQSSFVNTSRDIRFFATDLSAFGINASNAGDAVALIYQPGGSSDPAFLAFNEPSLGAASQISVLSQPTNSFCDGTLDGVIQVQVEDFNGNAIAQDNIQITAHMESGPGNLFGTLTQVTNAIGVATFNDLQFEIGANHTIRFEFSSLAEVITANISAPTNCSSGSDIWTGDVNSDWDNAGNWQSGSVPNANFDVEIPTGRPNYPILLGNAGARNLTLGDNASVTVNGYTFGITGTITAAANSSIQACAANSELYFSGTSKQFMENDIYTCPIANLIIENASGLDVEITNIEISETLQLRNGNLVVTTGNSVTMLCSFSPRKTALIGESNGTITGNFVTEQCFPARRAFRFVNPSLTTTSSIRFNWQENASSWNSDPVPGYGTHITGLGQQNPEGVGDGTNGFDWQPSGNPSMYVFDNENQLNGWSAIGNTDATTLSAGTPYRLMIRGSRATDVKFNNSPPTNTILRETGTVTNGSVSNNNPNFSANLNDFIFIGNPYQSMVDLETVFANSSNILPFVMYWDPTLGGVPTVGQAGGRGAFVVVDVLANNASNTSSQVNKFLEPKQAVFFYADGNGTPVINFEESFKVLSRIQTETFSLPLPNINIQLYDLNSFTEGNTSDDGLQINFSELGNNAVDALDAEKTSNIDENLARIVGSSLISIESRSLPEDNEILPLFINQYKSLDYTFQINSTNFQENVNVYLVDSYLGVEHLLNDQQTNINFSVDPNIAASVNMQRFSLKFEVEALSLPNLDNEVLKVYPNPVTNQKVWIILPELNLDKVDIEVISLIGQKLKTYALSQQEINDKQILLTDFNFEKGTYFLHLKTDQHQYVTKLIVP